MTERFCYSSPIGFIIIDIEGEHIVLLEFVKDNSTPTANNDGNAVYAECASQLTQYFEGTLTQFSLPLKLRGTTFQNEVWNHLAAIPYGTTISYSDLAERIGRPKSTRAVGAANGQNPVSIVLPCHRVIGKSGKLTGYGGGLWRKEWLLDHEQSVLHPNERLFH